ncbi:MAG: precorrin-4 C(11)-methyltransferase [Synechococcales cyanobacterium K44_A2020_017]|nr:precorrin-4 C(11)-methyltransferase [Synechococcales cyanobacterium K32_A2020_035]MBF2093817.1 precorrin-4 C(11)-methyltransferase [Synechococcales cyanobacterium K44_A2020_017]
MTLSQSDRPYPISIVGAGPGAPDLITVRGQRLLTQADVVFYTGSLVPEQMLESCRPDVEVIDTRSLVLETWRSQLVERARAGKKVVRLQDGDPCLYGALHELMVYLLAEHLEFEIVPGVSAFQAAAAHLKTELTVPNLVQTIILTRTQGKTDVPSREDLSQLAAHQASLCLYLSAHHCAKAQAQLLDHYPADTPMALCYRLGWPDEQVIVGQLDQMTDLTRTANLTRTVLYVISPALAGSAAARSRLYSGDHAHIFRPKSQV